MNSFLKNGTSIFVLFFILIAAAGGQDSLTVLNKSWQQLTTQLRKKADVAVSIVKDIGNPNKDEKIMIEKTKSTAMDLISLIDSSDGVDSLIVRIIYKKNNKLTQALSKALIMITDNSKNKSKSQLQQLQMQLEGTENRIHFAIRQYNDACIQYKRPDLVFDTSGKAPEVRF